MNTYFATTKPKLLKVKTLGSKLSNQQLTKVSETFATHYTLLAFQFCCDLLFVILNVIVSFNKRSVLFVLK